MVNVVLVTVVAKWIYKKKCNHVERFHNLIFTQTELKVRKILPFNKNRKMGEKTR